ncbi:MAG: PilZ domain-containing protein [bacterium]
MEPGCNIFDRRIYEDRRTDVIDTKNFDKRKPADRRTKLTRRINPRTVGEYNIIIEHSTNGTHNGKTINFGDRGLCVVSDREIGTAGTPVKIRMELDKTDITANAKIAWVKKSNDGAYINGVLLEVDDQTLLILKKILWLANDYVEQYLLPKLTTIKIDKDSKSKIVSYFKEDVTTFIKEIVNYEKQLKH